MAALVAACGGTHAVEPDKGVRGKAPNNASDVTGKDPLPGTGSAYDGKGFVVHEWGTNTVVVGSDGTLQRGLHHEEEDLPAFVYDGSALPVVVTGLESVSIYAPAASDRFTIVATRDASGGPPTLRVLPR